MSDIEEQIEAAFDRAHVAEQKCNRIQELLDSTMAQLKRTQAERDEAIARAERAEARERKIWAYLENGE